MLNAASERFITLSSRFQPIFLILSSNSNPKLTRSFSLSCNNDFLDSFDVLLQQCFTLQQARQIHSQLVLTTDHHSSFLAAKLIAVYARFGSVSDARKVFGATPIEGLQHLLLWNSIIRANVSHGHYEYAVELYVRMRKLGFLPDGFTLPLIIRACSYLAIPSLCKIFHCHALQVGFRNHLHVVNELVGMYGKLGRMEDACQLFDGMIVRSLVSWNTIVSGYAFNCDSLSAFRIFKRVELEGLQPNFVTWTSLLSSHAIWMELTGEVKQGGENVQGEFGVLMVLIWFSRGIWECQGLDGGLGVRQWGVCFVTEMGCVILFAAFVCSM